MATVEVLRKLAVGERPIMTRRGATIGIAVILLLLLYLGAALLFNRTNPEREVHLTPIQQHLPFLPGPLTVIKIYWRGGW